MKAGFRYKKLASLTLAVALGILAGLLVWGGVARAPEWLWRIRGKLIEHPTYLIYLPDGYQTGKPYPLVFALSPSADAFSMISVWAPVANRHGWIVAASKESRNGVDFDLVLQQVEAELDDVEKNYKIEPDRVIFTGLSGGGMVAHAFSKFHPARVTAIVINTGMMEETFMTDDYPQGKLAVFLASPADFRYQEMQRDRSFLEAHHWKTTWIEFSGGHTLAPVAIYEQTAAWLEENLPKYSK
jgi:predicted esterase